MASRDDRLVDLVMEFGRAHPDLASTFHHDPEAPFNFNGSLAFTNVAISADSTPFNGHLVIRPAERSLGSGTKSLLATGGDHSTAKMADAEVTLLSISYPLFSISFEIWSEFGLLETTCGADLLLQDFATARLALADTTGNYSVHATVVVNPVKHHGNRYQKPPLVWAPTVGTDCPLPSPPQPQLSTWGSASSVLSSGLGLLGSAASVGLTLFDSTTPAATAESKGYDRGRARAEKPRTRSKTPARRMKSPIRSIATVAMDASDKDAWDAEESVAALRSRQMAELIEDGAADSILPGCDVTCEALQIWRVEGSALVLDARASLQAKLRIACAYIVLPSRAQPHVFYWIGSTCLRDQSAIAAFRAASFAKSLRVAASFAVGSLRQQLQGNEDDAFVALFDHAPVGLKYEEAFGGGESALSSAGAASRQGRTGRVESSGRKVARLLRVAADPRASPALAEVAPFAQSLDASACFLLETGGDRGALFVWYGSLAPQSARARAFELARLLSAKDGRGAPVTPIEQGDDSAAILHLLGAAGAARGATKQPSSSELGERATAHPLGEVRSPVRRDSSWGLDAVANLLGSAAAETILMFGADALEAATARAADDVLDRLLQDAVADAATFHGADKRGRPSGRPSARGRSRSPVPSLPQRGKSPPPARPKQSRSVPGLDMGLQLADQFSESFAPWLTAFAASDVGRDDRLLGGMPPDDEAAAGADGAEALPDAGAESKGEGCGEGVGDGDDDDESPDFALYRVGFMEGQLEVAEVGARPLSRAMLRSGGVFILDCGAEAMVWYGRDSGVSSRLAGAEVARRMVLEEGNVFATGRPPWASFSQV